MATDSPQPEISHQRAPQGRTTPFYSPPTILRPGPGMSEIRRVKEPLLLVGADPMHEPRPNVGALSQSSGNRLQESIAALEGQRLRRVHDGGELIVRHVERHDPLPCAPRGRASC